MTDRVSVGNLSVSEGLHTFICKEALVGKNIEPLEFWSWFSFFHDLAPKNWSLIAERLKLQYEINTWCKK